MSRTSGGTWSGAVAPARGNGRTTAPLGSESRRFSVMDSLPAASAAVSSRGPCARAPTWPRDVRRMSESLSHMTARIRSMNASCDARPRPSYSKAPALSTRQSDARQRPHEVGQARRLPEPVDDDHVDRPARADRNASSAPRFHGRISPSWVRCPSGYNTMGCCEVRPASARRSKLGLAGPARIDRDRVQHFDHVRHERDTLRVPVMRDESRMPVGHEQRGHRDVEERLVVHHDENPSPARGCGPRCRSGLDPPREG